MASPVTGVRKGATSAVRCIDVAALVAAALLRVNKEARVLPFDDKVVQMTINPRDSIMTNAHLLASIGGGGTNCSAPLAKLNADGARVDLVVFVSDNQSWMDAKGGGQTTGVMVEWRKLKARCPDAKLVCVDIQPYGTTQAPDADDILNVGGFSDAVFETIATFARGEMGADHWLAEIDAIAV
jgi:60 kDa SS-A/Ro ribonucleoprotein